MRPTLPPRLLAFTVLLCFANFAARAAAGKDSETKTDAAPVVRTVHLRDISSIEGVRDNQLVGYGLVVGLNNTGDRQQTFFPVQTLANMLRRLGVQITPSQVVVKNIASVFVTATLPPFARPGAQVDATVSSAGDAKSLEGGVLLLTPLYAPNGEVYAVAQGPLTLGGYSAGTRANSKTVSQPTVGRIPNGAIVERDASVDLSHLTKVAFLLHDADFKLAQDAAAAINKELGHDAAHAFDGGRVEVDAASGAKDNVAALLARLGEVTVAVPPVSKVIVNERTGTIVLGRDASLGSCSILQGALAIQISTEYRVSQPQPLSKGGQTEVVPETTVQAKENPAQVIHLQQGATVEDLVRGLQAIGATAHDIVAVLQAIKSAGALQAQLEVI